MKVLLAGMAFPHDFGFVPSTRAEDGDPVDVLVLMDEPAAVGCLMSCRIIGIIEGEQGRKKDPERNDRIIAIEQANHSFADIRHVRDLGKQFQTPARSVWQEPLPADCPAPPNIKRASYFDHFVFCKAGGWKETIICNTGKTSPRLLGTGSATPIERRLKLVPSGICDETSADYTVV